MPIYAAPRNVPCLALPLAGDGGACTVGLGTHSLDLTTPSTCSACLNLARGTLRARQRLCSAHPAMYYGLSISVQHACALCGLGGQCGRSICAHCVLGRKAFESCRGCGTVVAICTRTQGGRELPRMWHRCGRCVELALWHPNVRANTARSTLAAH